jgi:hypothetical protein
MLSGWAPFSLALHAARPQTAMVTVAVSCDVECGVGDAECGTRSRSDSPRCPRRKSGQAAEAGPLFKQESETLTRPGKDAKPPIRESVSEREGWGLVVAAQGVAGR